MVRERLEPSRDMREFQSWDLNCRPRSVAMVEGTPKREMQPARKAWATDSAVMEVRGIASGQRVNLSTHVRRYVNPRDGGSGPTRSMWMTSKRASGFGKVEPGACV